MKCHKCNHEWTPRKIKPEGNYYTCGMCQSKTRGK
jgi:hypothetical protein